MEVFAGDEVTDKKVLELLSRNINKVIGMEVTFYEGTDGITEVRFILVDGRSFIITAEGNIIKARTPEVIKA